MNDFGIAHEKFDYREYTSRQVAKHTKFSKLYPVFMDNKTAEEQRITYCDFDALFNNSEYENGLVILMEMHQAIMPAYEMIKQKSKQIIAMIEDELMHQALLKKLECIQ